MERTYWKRFATNLLATMQAAPVSSGVCCYGESVVGHPDPSNCGHFPVDQWDDLVASFNRDYQQLLAQDAPSNTLDAWAQHGPGMIGDEL